ACTATASRYLPGLSALLSGNDQDGTRGDLQEAMRDAPEQDEVRLCRCRRVCYRMGRPAHRHLMDIELGLQTIRL
ncbi:MAG: hypothetical protein WCB51_00125, partial [Candidatus Dormiibacterota bacterium]